MKFLFCVFAFSAVIVNSFSLQQDLPSLLSQLRAENDSPCFQAFEYLFENDKKLFWQMIDASSKFPASGLLANRGLDYGNYDECVAIEYKDNNTTILGKNCAPGLLIPYQLIALLGIPVGDFIPDYATNAVQLSLCMPDVCKPSDLLLLIPQLIFNVKSLKADDDFDIKDMFVDLNCITKDSGKELSDLDIGITALFSVVFALIVASTTYDVYNYKMEQASMHPLLVAFSVFSNGRKLVAISKTKSKDQFHIFSGFRLISMMWIVAGHGFGAWLSLSAVNGKDILAFQGKRYSQYIATAPLAVDTFFYMSGFLLAYGYLKSEKPLSFAKQVISVPYMYLHRYLRITPALAMVYLTTISLYKHLGHGPIYIRGFESFKKPCVENWWSFFLYLQNYYNYDDLCLTQTWYLAADWQMFLLAPLILIPMSLHIRKRFMTVMCSLMALNVFCIALPIAVKYIWRDYPNPYDTHSRLINYTIGLTMGAYMRLRMHKPFPFSKIANFLIWCFMLGLMLATIMLYQEVLLYPTFDNQTIYYSFMRPMWCISISWFVYSCYHGYGGIADWVLNNSITQVGARLTYCLYCTHGSLVVYYAITRRTRSYFSDYDEYYIWCGHFLTSVVVSIVWTLAFESPLIIIEKFIFGGAPAKKTPPAPNHQ